MAENPAGRARTSPGIVVSRIEPGSPSDRAGLKEGDRITHVDGQGLADFLDFYTAAFGDDLILTIERGVSRHKLRMRRERAEATGLTLGPEQPATCNNRCVFCFVDQMPPGLRPSLYVKDEDYRFSFLHGNYLTLTNLKPSGEKRIVRMHLSPLYISVHATDETVRARLLGRRAGAGILSTLDRLGEAGIRFHTQVVVVPGYNDGEILRKTLEDLSHRHRFILSVSLVPVGLTGHRQALTRLRPVDAGMARQLVEFSDDIQRRMRRLTGRGLLYASDEIFLLGGGGIPPAWYYDDYPQLDNGVGLLRILLDSARSIKVPPGLRGRRILLVTGLLAAPHIENIAAALSAQGTQAQTLAVANALFGPTITVSGLLAGRDIIEALRQGGNKDVVVLPPNVANSDGLTLDDMRISEIAGRVGIPVVVGDYDMELTLERVNSVLKPKP